MFTHTVSFLQTRRGLVVLIVTAILVFIVTQPPPPPREMFMGGDSSVDCSASGSYTGSHTYSVLTAAPLRGSIGCVNEAALKHRSVVEYDKQIPLHIFGPFEAGFTAFDPGASCLGFNYVVGGVDTGLAHAVISHLCGGRTMRVLDYCGGHAVPYHYHESMDCLYEASATPGLVGHSTKIGTLIDGNPLYGKYISVDGTAALPSDLDACGGRVGITPDSNGIRNLHFTHNYAS